MSILTVDWLAREALLILQNNLVPTLLMDREYEGSFTGTEARGDTVRIRRRDRGNAQEFTGAISSRQLEESKVDLKLERHVDASFAITTRELTLDLDDFSSQVLEPQVVSIAEDVDRYAASKYKDLPSFANVDGSNVAQALPTTISSLAQARKVLNNQKVPMAGRVMVHDPELEAAFLSIDSFTEADKKGDEGTALREASLGRILGLDHFMGQNVDGDTPLVAPAAADVVGVTDNNDVVGATSVQISGLSVTTTFPLGTPITIDHAVSDGGPKNYILAADMVTSAGGVGTAVLYDPTTNGLIRGEQLKAPTVAATTVVTINTATAGDSYFRRGALFHPRAFAFASVPLAVPPEAEGAVISDGGLSIRVIRDYDITSKQSVISLDVLVGAKVVQGELGAQFVTAA